MGNNAVTGSARRRCEIDGVLAEEQGRRNCKSKEMGRVVQLICHVKKFCFAN